MPDRDVRNDRRPGSGKKCPRGFYSRNGKCRKSITTHPERAGTYGKGFLSKPQKQEYAKIDQVEKYESPKLVDRQTAAMNSWTYRDSGSIHRHAHDDLIYAENYEKREGE